MAALQRHLASPQDLIAAMRPGAAVAGGLSERAFREVRAYLEDNLSERISLADIAAVAGISRFHFARQFRVRTGESPMGFLLRARVERAKTMLQAGTTTVADIAATLGFADQSHFTRTFRKMVGMSPSLFSSATTVKPTIPGARSCRH